MPKKSIFQTVKEVVNFSYRSVAILKTPLQIQLNWNLLHSFYLIGSGEIHFYRTGCISVLKSWTFRIFFYMLQLTQLACNKLLYLLKHLSVICFSLDSALKRMFSILAFFSLLSLYGETEALVWSVRRSKVTNSSRSPLYNLPPRQQLSYYFTRRLKELIQLFFYGGDKLFCSCINWHLKR